jgi:hypothetical protein
MKRSLFRAPLALVVAACASDSSLPSAPIAGGALRDAMRPNPAVIIIPVDTVTADEGSVVHFAGESTLDASAGLDGEWWFNDPDGSWRSVVYPSATVATDFTYDDNNFDSGYTVSLGLVSRADGSSESKAFLAIINNVAPTATLQHPATVAPGASFTVSLVDPDDPSAADRAAGFHHAFDCGSGFGEIDPSSSATCTAPSSGSVTVRGTILDKDGGERSYTGTVLVADPCTAPSIGPLVLPEAPTPIGTAVTVSATYTGTVTSATFLWDDGVTTPATESAGSYRTTRTISAPGVYKVTATVASTCGSDSETAETYTVVYDPSGGFVTGGGWFMAQPGSYAADPSLDGKSTFGFVSKYHKGANTPSGNTEFQFHANGFDFHSEAYEWLVVAGTKAQYKGTGRIKGRAGSYGFMVTAIDNGSGGSSDAFRIRIWERTASGDVVVFDNKMGADESGAASTTLSGGYISIKKN